MRSFFTLKRTFSVAAISLALTACGGSGNGTKTDPAPKPDPVVMDYQEVLDNTLSTEIPGVILLVKSPQNEFLGSAGVADLDSQEALLPDHSMPTASAGKPMIALLAAQLADEGFLNLDDTLDTWLPEEILSRIANSSQVTLKQLLNHTSGIFNFVDNDAYVELLLASPGTLKTDIDFLPLAYDQPAYFLPGEGYEYSNTGYLLAGLILDQVLGEHHSLALRDRVFTPLAMSNTYYRGIEKERGDFISGYENIDGEMFNAKPYMENIGAANTPVVSTVEDMALFLKSMISDDSFINQDIRDTLFGEANLIDAGNNEYNGLGIGKAVIDGNNIYAHSGLTYGYYSQNAYIKEKDTSITVFMNCSSRPVCVDALDGIVTKVLQEVL